MRIALVTETYPPEINGVATTVAQLVEGLLREGHFVELTRPLQVGIDRSGGRDVGPDRIGTNDEHQSEATDPSGFLERLTRGVPIPRYPGLRMGLPATRQLMRAWRQHPPDIVHIATEGLLGWSALRAARRLGIPIVSEFRTNFHAYSTHYGLGVLRWWILRYLRRFHNRCDWTMVPTAGLAAELKASGFERLKVVARGVDARRFDPARRSDSLRASWGANPSTLVVISVGRIAPEKNLELLISAFRRMREVRQEIRLVIVGDGPARPELERELPQAIFVGRRVGEDLAVHYASADLLLFPSLTETFGNVTLEAMASGLAVLAFDYGAAGQLIGHGVHGWVSPYAETSTFQRLAAEAASELESVRRLGAQGRRVAESMCWTGIVREVVSHYITAVGMTGSAR